MKVMSLSCVQLFATPRTAAYQAPPSIAFSRQEYWSGWPVPSPPINERLLKYIHSAFEQLLSAWFFWVLPHICVIGLKNAGHGMLHLFSFPEF